VRRAEPDFQPVDPNDGSYDCNGKRETEYNDCTTSSRPIACGLSGCDFVEFDGLHQSFRFVRTDSKSRAVLEKEFYSP
jgi:hypothetical protein